ncbi:hypothetical protein ATY35_06135 [Vibrio cidicii]|jgi:hypothetical protein|uniref:Uncharacterized protein n=2 Tax=Vibrio TaxID=662 RepID=A0AAI9G958_9VIBR|nr:MULTISPECIES: hypothetical protein [Vibrio]EJN6827295.1 hypothetical protein [Vibrio cidicii]ELN6933022.1 hypothetical protein [Vibrio navarrensis]ELV8624058.1 hypothetical protein [Vibrio cidicii]KGK13046.1 hypothetical protein DC58_08375 [Vibrio navarrensis]KGK13701.1 hypothetical protein EA24_15500 [Vibrio navarrensis]
MDKDLLARKLYLERVSTLVGQHEIDEELITEMWENRASPSEAAKVILEGEHFSGPAWLNRYLNRK